MNKTKMTKITKTYKMERKRKTTKMTRMFEGFGQIRSMNFPRGHFGINDISPFRASLSSQVHQNGPCYILMIKKLKL